MTDKAIDVLSTNDKGYFLMVENGNIDHANHKNNAYRALSETQDLSKTIAKVLSKVNLDETLILVTADHSHPLTIVGYPKRGNPILGLVSPVSDKKGGLQINNAGIAVDNDNDPYTTLGYRIGAVNDDYEPNNTEEKEFKQQTLIPMKSGFHSGEDVALYGIGPKSFLVGGVLEQNVIFHIITEAFGWNN